MLRDKVQYLGGLVFTPNALAIADLITEAETPTVIFNAATSVITRKSHYFIRVSQTTPQVAAPIGEWAAKHGIKTAVTAVSDYGPGFDGEEYFSKAFKAGGGQGDRVDPHPARDDRLPAVLRARAQGQARRAVHLRAGRTAHRRHDQYLGLAAQALRYPAAVHRGDPADRPAEDRSGRAVGARSLESATRRG
ncbi:MAG: ABC transporter substrate-binding protein [Betaproteobacteria bacterium]|nr:ABC transporter substrate-binding protein [Betaproteobacteria bacterium]